MTDQILKKADTLPEWLLEIFKLIDAKDFDALFEHMADDCTIYFAHYVFHSAKQALGFIGTFDNRLPKYQHIMNTIYVGEDVVHFDGTLRVWLDDGSIIETPFWDKVFRLKGENKVQVLYAIFSIAAFPGKFWKDLRPEDFA